MYLRFVIHQQDQFSGRRQGLFTALYSLEYAEALLPYELAVWNDGKRWFNRYLERPHRFSRSSKTSAKNVALSWFKDRATHHITRMYALAQMLEDYGLAVDVIRTAKPGYVVYEDQDQVAAVPFATETTT